MSDRTEISWTDATWNPVRGCSKVSAGCKHCYAERFAERFRGVAGHPFEKGFDVRLVPEALDLPLRWRRPRRVFVNSMSDLFHEDVPEDFIEAVFGVMSLAGRHTFQVLTKRADRMHAFLERATLGRCQAAAVVAGVEIQSEQRRRERADDGVINGPWPLPNVWIGCSVEDQAAADERIPHLLATPAAVRFLSCEPLLGPVNLHQTDAFWGTGAIPGQCIDIDGDSWHRPDGPPCPHCGHRMRVDWVIVGGESGPGARPCNAAWIRSLVAACRAAWVPVFVKQLGAFIEDRNDAGFDGHDRRCWPIHIDEEVRVEHLDEGYQGAPVRVRTRDRAGRDPAEWPEDLRVREMPR